MPHARSQIHRRDEVGQLHERLDFTERLLTQQSSRAAIGPHGEEQ